MRIEYDPKVDAAYIFFVPDTERTAAMTYACDPVQVKGEINIDFDAEGQLLGIEVLDASRFLSDKLLASASPPGQSSSIPPDED